MSEGDGDEDGGGGIEVYSCAQWRLVEQYSLRAHASPVVSADVLVPGHALGDREPRLLVNSYSRLTLFNATVAHFRAALVAQAAHPTIEHRVFFKKCVFCGFVWYLFLVPPRYL